MRASRTTWQSVSGRTASPPVTETWPGVFAANRRISDRCYRSIEAPRRCRKCPLRRRGVDVSGCVALHDCARARPPPLSRRRRMDGQIGDALAGAG
jgi:hypothetical protein